MKKVFTALYMLTLASGLFGQQFEETAGTLKDEGKPQINVGADFAMQFQALSQHADSALLVPLGSNFNIPTANLRVNAILADGIEVNLTTYLSSRHHVEAWVKGGYLLLDKLPFIHSDAVAKAMDFLTLKVGVMEINYGDAHFRRSDNGEVINNMFVGNYIMDAFTTAPALEVLYRNNGVLLMGALSSGTLKPALTGYNSSTGYTPYNVNEELAFYWKAGYDKQLSDDLRLRATLSGYHVGNHHSGSLYNGDRAGSRYYLVMIEQSDNSNDVDPSKSLSSGRWGPGSTDKDNSLMANLFLKYKGLDFFGTYEMAKGTTASDGSDFDFSQVAVEGLYHFGKEDQFFGGVRYNNVMNDVDNSVNRVQISAGWLLTPNILLKAEYVDQNYKDFAKYGGNAGFDGVMIESTISF